MKAWMVAVVLLVVMSSFAVTGVGTIGHAPSPVLSTAAVSTDEQVVGVASQYGMFSGTFWQNGSATYQTGSIPWTFPVNFTNYTSLTYSAFAIGVSVADILQPMVHVQQGSAVLLNNTGTGTFTVYPKATTNLVTTLPAAFAPGGGTPAVGSYLVKEAAQFVTEYQSLHASSWTLSGTTESESFTATSPSGVWLNQTTIFLPFPLPLSVNYTSVGVTVNSTAYSYVQVTSNGVYIVDPSLAPSASIKFSVSFSVAPTETGTSPILVVSNFTTSGTSPTYTASATWVNRAYPLWGGIYTIEFNIGYTPDPSSLNITANGHTLKDTQYIASGNVITVLPLALLTPMNGSDSFKFLFDLPAAPSSAHTSLGTSISFLGLTFSFGDLLLFLLAAGVVGIVIVWIPRYVDTFEGKTRKNPVTPERYYITFGLVGLIVAVLATYGLLAA